MFHAQQTIAHSLIQSTQSLAFEAYAVKTLEFNDKSGIKGALTTAITSLYDFAVGADDYFSNDDKWYSDSDKCATAAKQRFVGYFTNGNEEEADNLLKDMRIVDGLDGLDFSDSKVEDGILYTVVKYKIEYMFKLGDVGVVDAEQAFSAKLWGF